MSASSKTTTGALPPSSRCTRLSVSAACAAIHLPVSTEPVSETMSTSGCSTSAAPVSLPPAMTLSTPLGRNSAGELGQLERGHGRRLGGLEHDRVAGRQRRADLPDRHHQRVVPRRDLADHADRLAADHRRVALEVLAGGLALQAARGAGEEAQVVDHRRDLVVLERLQRLAGVGRLELGDLVGVLLDRVGEPQERQRALARASCSAQPSNAPARGLDGAVDVGRRSSRAPAAIASPVAGLTTAVGRALRRVDELAVDEVRQPNALVTSRRCRARSSRSSSTREA